MIHTTTRPPPGEHYAPLISFSFVDYLLQRRKSYVYLRLRYEVIVLFGRGRPHQCGLLVAVCFVGLVDRAAITKKGEQVWACSPLSMITISKGEIGEISLVFPIQETDISLFFLMSLDSEGRFDTTHRKHTKQIEDPLESLKVR